MTNRMFSFITGTFNPVGGECPYDCSYCWAKSLINRYKYVKYQGPARLDEKAMRKIPDEGFIFVQDMSDISILGAQDTNRLMAELKYRPKATYLLLTKNPMWYIRMIEAGVEFPDNATLGATIETNRIIECSKAPPPADRLVAMGYLRHKVRNNLFVSIEPIMDFDRDVLLSTLSFLHPWGVAIGYDNYHNRLPEPRLAKTTELIKALETRGITVYEKTLREAWTLGAAEARING